MIPPIYKGWGSPFAAQAVNVSRSCIPPQKQRSEAYMHQLLLGVILLGAVCPVAVGLVDDHLGLLFAVIPVQVFLEIGQLLLGEGKTTST